MNGNPVSRHSHDRYRRHWGTIALILLVTALTGQASNGAPLPSSVTPPHPIMAVVMTDSSLPNLQLSQRGIPGRREGGGTR